MLMEGIETSGNEALLLRWCNDGTRLFMASHITRYILEQWKSRMRSVPREEHRRLRNAKNCACRYHSPTPQMLIANELLDQQQLHALPVGIISGNGN